LITDRVNGFSGNGNPIQTGLGARTASITPNFLQGSIRSTGINTNLALQGDGFFITNNVDGETRYTRAGNFNFTDIGNGVARLVTSDGSAVQGYNSFNADGTINSGGAIGDLDVDFNNPSPPSATELVRFVTNLPATAEVGTRFTGRIDVYDSTGEIQPLTVTFTKGEDVNQWTYQFDYPAGDVSTTEPNNGSGTLTFGTDGRLATFDGISVNDPAITNKTIRITDLNNGAEDLAITWDLIGGGGDSSRLTNYSSDFNTAASFQDGIGSGTLQSVQFSPDGTLVGFFSNGETSELGQVALARFINNSGLKQLDGNNFQETNFSGAPEMVEDGEVGIVTDSLETSNVDIAGEFTDLIVYQRGFQSSSRTITTSDQILQEIIGLKR
jgi:flagellar hook protein FlgE